MKATAVEVVGSVQVEGRLSWCLGRSVSPPIWLEVIRAGVAGPSAATTTSWLARASLGLGGLPLANQPTPVAGPEDEKKGEEGERQRPGRDRELLADGVGDDGGARASAERCHEEGLLRTHTPRRERERACDRLHAHHQQHVLEGPADVEGIEEEPERGEAKQPADELPDHDPARVAGGLAEDHEAPLEPPRE